MNIIYKKTAELIPYEQNTKKHDKTQIDNVAKSIEKFGFVQPVVVDKNNVVIIGHCRLLAAKKLKLKEVPCYMAEDLTEEQVRQLRIVDNKTNESEWDEAMLELEFADIDLSEFMFDFDLPAFEDAPTEIVEDDFDEEEIEGKEPVAKLGDIWQLGRHRLMCGDSTSLDDVGKLIGGAEVDMLFTDPPYNVAFNGRSGKFDVIKNDNLSESEFADFINATIKTIKTINAPIYYIWCNWKFYGILQNKLDYKSCIVWAKNVFGMGKGYRHQHEFCLFNGEIDDEIKNESDLWQIKKDHTYMHPTQKPIDLPFRAINNHKNVKTVLDLFGGSGSTLIACEQTNRECLMMELDAHYVDVIIARWEKFTGQKAVLLNG